MTSPHEPKKLTLKVLKHSKLSTLQINKIKKAKGNKNVLQTKASFSSLFNDKKMSVLTQVGTEK